MNRPRVALFAAIAVSATSVIGISALSFGASQNTQCWDEYNPSGTRRTGVLTPRGLKQSDCTPGTGCFTSSYPGSTRVVRLYVPYRARPATACSSTTTTTTTAPTTTVPAPPASKFALLPVGATLPTDADCAARVRPMTENRAGNATANATRGTVANATYPRVTGNFTGTTDEILQWVACKWGIDEDYVRAQVLVESNWNQAALGDFTTTASACSPAHPIGTYPPQFTGDTTHTGQCPESVGLGQVRYPYHQAAFADLNAVTSSAYNLDYVYGVWRACYEGQFTWLNQAERGRDYVAGDATGCLGVWFAGRWYTQAAQGYISTWYTTLGTRAWEQAAFPPAVPRPATPATTTTTAVVTTTTVKPTTTAPKPTTTVAATTTAPKPTTTVQASTTTIQPTTTTIAEQSPPAGASVQFSESFDTDRRDRFDWQLQSTGTPPAAPFLGDHATGAPCGNPYTYRTVNPVPLQPGVLHDRVDITNSELVWWCAPGNDPAKGHMMTGLNTDSVATLNFSPKQVLNNVTRVCWDQNMTDLGAGKWLNIFVVPNDAYVSGGSNLAYAAGVGIPFGGIPQMLPPGAVDFTWVGGTVMSHKVQPDGSYRQDFYQWDSIPLVDANGDGTIDRLDPPASGMATDPAPRFTICIDDGANQVTIERPDGALDTYAYNISFPSGQVRVIFQDASYNPVKHVGFENHLTWHWDNIIIN